MNSLDDYWRTVSYGNIDLQGTQVRGWFWLARNAKDEGARSRWDKINDCVDAAHSGGYNVPSGWHIAAVYNQAADPGDSGSAGGRVLVDPGAQNPSFIGHEMGHGYNMVHSFTDDLTYQNAPWSQPGEYGDGWDLMSNMAGWKIDTGHFGTGGPGINASYLDQLGWIPERRIITIGDHGILQRAVQLTALNRPGNGGALMVKIPFDPSDSTHYYTVEMRHRAGWDGGIPRDAVLIHDLRPNSNCKGGSWRCTSYVISTQGGAEWIAGRTFHGERGVSVKVESIDAVLGTAIVSVTGSDWCKQGFVWREANASDHVCVTGFSRSVVRTENQLGPSRRQGSGPYGPDTCKSAYVWREANSSDHICVPVSSRTRVRGENSLAVQRRIEDGTYHGPDRCTSGYVWREATNSDHVCVAPSARTQARIDNSLAASRRQGFGPYGPDTCKSGYVWREAAANDRVCVLLATRTQAQNDNTAAGDRVVR